MPKSKGAPAERTPKWNSGRREWPRWRAERARCVAVLEQLERHEALLKKRYGTSWPAEDAEQFAADFRSAKDELHFIDGQQDEPWFPKSLLRELEDCLSISIEDHPKLIDALWRAVDAFVRKRSRQAVQGRPRLLLDQRQQLQGVEAAARKFIVACGDVKLTQDLIGGWAVGGLLNGLTLLQLVDAVGLLGIEVSKRLSQDGAPRPAHRPKDRPLDAFTVEVVAALMSAGEPVSVSRSGSVDRVLRVLLKASGQRVPVDLFRAIRRAVRHVNERQPGAVY